MTYDINENVECNYIYMPIANLIRTQQVYKLIGKKLNKKTIKKRGR